MNAHAHHEMHGSHGSLNRLALTATLHCLTGCGIGEVLGLVIATWLGWSTVASIALAVALAFVFGYALAMRPLLASGLSLGQALRLALAADTVSIIVMEIIDNAMMLAIPGAMDAHVTDPFFWGSLLVVPRPGLRGDVPRQPLADQPRPGARPGPRLPHPDRCYPSPHGAPPWTCLSASASRCLRARSARPS